MVADRERPPGVPPLAPDAVTTHWIQSAEVERPEKRAGAERAAVPRSRGRRRRAKL